MCCTWLSSACCSACYSMDIAEKFHFCSIVVAPLHPIHRSTPLVHCLTEMCYCTASSHNLVWYMLLWCWSQICHVRIWVNITWTVTSLFVCVCVCVYFLNMKLCVLQFCRNTTNISLVIFKMYGKEFISKSLHFVNWMQNTKVEILKPPQDIIGYLSA